MKILIDTHASTEAEVEALVQWLRDNNWDIQINNKADYDPTAPKDVEEVECQHNFQNGVCTKCQWLDLTVSLD